MIDATDIVTYRSENCARESLRWVAYVVLPNGTYLGVMFTGETEQEAIEKAIKLWNSERAKLSKAHVEVNNLIPDEKIDPWAGVGRGHHFAGKVWMRHILTRDLVRVPLTEVALHEKNGYVRSGPRSK